MNSNTTEEQIKQNLDSLDTLQAGIVFGREDAWDKLQARLDAKPIRKPFPIFRIAAAAALVLVLVTIAITYLQPGQNTNVPAAIVKSPNHNNSHSDVIASSHPETGRRTNHDISIGQGAPTPSPSPLERRVYPELAEVGVRPNSINLQNFISSAPVKPHQPVQQNAPQEPQPPIAELQQPAVAIAPPPTPVPQPKMKVVHLNELDKEQAPAYEIADNNIPHPHVTFKMKVVHINDLMKPIQQEDYLREMQSNTAAHLSPFHRSYNNLNTDNRPKTLFRINLSN